MSCIRLYFKAVIFHNTLSSTESVEDLIERAGVLVIGKGKCTYVSKVTFEK